MLQNRLARLAFITAVTTSLFASQADAARILIVTDETRATKAREVAELFRKTAPFNRMSNLDFKVIQTTARKLGCQAAAISEKDEATLAALSDEDQLAFSEFRDRLARLRQNQNSPEASPMSLPPSCNNKGGTPERLISCDTPTARTYLNGLKKSEGARFAIVVKTDSRYGGSGGTNPVITSASPAAMALHELMHQLGFADEYGYYNACEADTYCGQQVGNDVSPSGFGNLPGTSFNVALFNSRGSYSGDSDVRAKHGAALPWLSAIASSTKLTTGSKLGSPDSSKTGIFRAIVCDKASKRMETWQSTPNDTIMRTLQTTSIPRAYWNTIARSLGTSLKSAAE